MLYERRAQKADFIRAHPSYDKTLWIFSQKSSIRQFCQKLVQPANGEHIFGKPYSTVAHPLFQLILLFSVIEGIVVEAVATPVYRRNYYREHGLNRRSWFDIAKTAFGLTLFVEFLIKIIVDGFLFTSNVQYMERLGFFVSSGLIVNLTTGLIVIGGLSRLTRVLQGR